MWYSPLIPLPPKMSLHSLAVRKATTSIRIMSTARISLYQRYHLRCQLVWFFQSWNLQHCLLSQSNVCQHLRKFLLNELKRCQWHPELLPFLLSHGYRSMVYSRALWKQNSAAPSVPQEMPNLALFKQENGPFKPLTVGNICSSCTRTSFIAIYPVIEALRDSFPSIFGAVSPCIPFSKMKPLMSPASSLAQTTKTSAIGELVIQLFVPFKM